MSLEATMIVIDNSDFARNGDYFPSRIESITDSCNLIFGAKLQQHPESAVGLLVTSPGLSTRGSGSCDLLLSPSSDIGQMLAVSSSITVGGDCDLIRGIQTAALALKHRVNKNQRQKIICFLASPLKGITEKYMEQIGKSLKKNNISIDLISIGETEFNSIFLKKLFAPLDPTQSHLLEIPPELLSIPNSALTKSLSDFLISTPVVTPEGQTPMMPGGDGGAFDPSMDPELAMALRMSMEEEEVRLGRQSGNTEAPRISPSPPSPEDEDEELRMALIDSLRDSNSITHQPPQPPPSPPPPSGEDEDEELRRALMESMEDWRSLKTPQSPPDMKLFQDPIFISQLLDSLPGTHPPVNSLNSKLSLLDLPLSAIMDKRVILRVDFNVPINKTTGKVDDKIRISSSIPTIFKIISMKPKSIIVISHLGRPDGTPNTKYSLKPCVQIMEELLNHKVIFLNDCVGSVIEDTCASAPFGSIILLENLRFHPEEESTNAKDPKVIEFRSSLTRLGDIYVNDAFGTAHRAHSSMVGINLPIRVAGLLLVKELEYFAIALEKPQRPFLTILGGAKVKDKIQLISSLLDKELDYMIIGGGMSFTFLKMIENISIGDSLFDIEGSQIVLDLIKKAKDKNIQLIFPMDWVCGDKFKSDAQVKTFNSTTGIPNGWMGMDIGPESIKKNIEIISKAKTIIWNGPLGVFEFPKFALGSKSVLESVIESTKNGAKSIIGGGDTASLVEQYGLADKVSHVSTGGGASLELLEGKKLPGVDSLSNKDLLTGSPSVK